ncbi:cellulose biosynthesis protein BcsD [Novosphingobium sp. 9U]|uniref:cellulose biosynthesis protein BcsD n=1 Tax=Novosphingobium sp. 9U TaxID=2653158 RepID=UPI0012F108AF|nr:hypothetical protein [Novosphingobium sp. 9U]VWX53627.1 conserved hypothetical protein [Novosphingobium sp. 9U]
MKFDPLHQMFGSSTAAPATPRASFAPLVAALAAELAETVPAPQRRGFYLAIGRRIAAAETLEGVEDASQLAWRVNAFWSAMGWGEAEVAIERDAIVVHHRDAPPAPEHVPSGPWLGMLLAVLEGAYDTWFRKLGSGPTLHTRAEWKGDTVELRHGR